VTNDDFITKIIVPNLNSNKSIAHFDWKQR
jgi:hypothetical protein